MKEKNSLLFSLSETPKKENEDFHTTFENQSFSGVIVADGVGSYSRAKDTSRFAVDLLKKEILKLNEDNIYDNLYKIFNEIEKKLSELGKENNCINCYATTLIISIKLKKEILIAYLGNGAILHIRNNMSNCKTNQLLSWGVTNYLIPHTDKNRDGKESLFKFLSSDENNDNMSKTNPTILRLTREYNNDMILLSTDGFHSNDQVSIGNIKKTGDILSIHDKKYIDILNIVDDFYKNENTSLRQNLESYLENIKEELDDDTTIGILIDNE